MFLTPGTSPVMVCSMLPGSLLMQPAQARSGWDFWSAVT